MIAWLTTPLTVSYAQMLGAGVALLVLFWMLGTLAFWWQDEVLVRQFLERRCQLLERLHREAEEDGAKLARLVDHLCRQGQSPRAPPPH